MGQWRVDRPESGASSGEERYVLELAGEDDAFAVREAATVASEVALLAPGLALARGLDRAGVRRLAYTRRANALFGRAEATVASAHALLESGSIDREGTVAVRARDVRGTTSIDTQSVERALGAVLVERGFEIDLDAPDQELRATFAAPAACPTDSAASETGETAPDATDSAEEGSSETASEAKEGGTCVLGWLAAESVRDFGERAPTNKPFFQPGSMDPLLARAIANIAGADTGTTVVDPMCGTGGLLVESGLAGSDVIGLDAQAKMVGGARRNLAHYLAGNELSEAGDENPTESCADGSARNRRDDRREGKFAVLQGDATRLPLREGVADGVCFDVPYGRQSLVAGDPDALVAGALTEARRLAPRAVIVGDRSWTEAARKAGWAVESTFERRVHRSLTRHIAVLEPAGPD